MLQGLSPSKKWKVHVDDSENTQISKDMTAVSNLEGDNENIYQQSDAMLMLPVQPSPNSLHLTSAIATGITISASILSFYFFHSQKLG